MPSFSSFLLVCNLSLPLPLPLPLLLPLLLSHFNHKTSATQNFVVWLLCAGNNPLYLTVDTWSCIAFPVASLLYPFVSFCFFVISFFSSSYYLSFFLSALICTRYVLMLTLVIQRKKAKRRAVYPLHQHIFFRGRAETN